MFQRSVNVLPAAVYATARFEPARRRTCQNCGLFVVSGKHPYGMEGGATFCAFAFAGLHGCTSCQRCLGDTGDSGKLEGGKFPCHNAIHGCGLFKDGSGRREALLCNAGARRLDRSQSRC